MTESVSDSLHILSYLLPKLIGTQTWFAGAHKKNPTHPSHHPPVWRPVMRVLDDMMRGLGRFSMGCACGTRMPVRIMQRHSITLHTRARSGEDLVSFVERTRCGTTFSGDGLCRNLALKQCDGG